jgi:hypothetical protein
MTHHCRDYRRVEFGLLHASSLLYDCASRTLYVCIYGTTIRYECDYYFSAVFEGGGEGDAEAVSSLVMRRAFLNAPYYMPRVLTT